MKLILAPGINDRFLVNPLVGGNQGDVYTLRPNPRPDYFTVEGNVTSERKEYHLSQVNKHFREGTWLFIPRESDVVLP